MKRAILGAMLVLAAGCGLPEPGAERESGLEEAESSGRLTGGVEEGTPEAAAVLALANAATEDLLVNEVGFTSYRERRAAANLVQSREPLAGETLPAGLIGFES